MNSPSDFPDYLTTPDVKKWYLKPQTFTCTSGYVTDITVNWGSYSSGMDSLNIKCSDGSTGSLGRSDIKTPHTYTIQNSSGISELTLYEGSNQIYSINGKGLGPNGGTAVTFTCPTGTVINQVSVLMPYKYSNYTYEYPYVAGFDFGCTQSTVSPSSSTPPSSSTSPSSSTPPSSSSSTTSSSSSTGLIIGIILVVIVVIVIAAVGIYYYMKKKEKGKEASKVKKVKI